MLPEYASRLLPELPLLQSHHDLGTMESLAAFTSTIWSVPICTVHVCTKHEVTMALLETWEAHHLTVLFVADVGVARPFPTVCWYMWKSPGHVDTTVRMCQTRQSRGTQIIIGREANPGKGSKPIDLEIFLGIYLKEMIMSMNRFSYKDRNSSFIHKCKNIWIIQMVLNTPGCSRIVVYCDTFKCMIFGVLKIRFQEL